MEAFLMYIPYNFKYNTKGDSYVAYTWDTFNTIYTYQLNPIQNGKRL